MSKSFVKVSVAGYVMRIVLAFALGFCIGKGWLF